MKILGKTESRHGSIRSYIVEVDIDEMAKLLGHYYAEGHIKVLEPGQVVRIAAMWDHLRELASLGGVISQVRTSLLKSAELLDGYPDPLEQIKIGPDNRGQS